MQQVAARNCLHGAASGARAGVSVLEELFWNAAARSVRFAASFAAAACICMQIARVPPRERDGLECVACDTWSDAAMHCGYCFRSDPLRRIITFWQQALCVRCPWPVPAQSLTILLVHTQTHRSFPWQVCW